MRFTLAMCEKYNILAIVVKSPARLTLAACEEYFCIRCRGGSGLDSPPLVRGILKSAAMIDTHNRFTLAICEEYYIPLPDEIGAHIDSPPLTVGNTHNP